MTKLTFRRVADPGAEDSYYLEPKGRFMAYDGETNVGFINFLRYPRDLSLHLDYLMVRPEYRGRGVGEVILRKFREWLHRNYAWVKYAASEVTSQKSLHLMNKVFGPPLYMSNGIRLVTLDEAMRALPASMETNEHGGLDAEGHIDVVHWIGVGRAPKDHPWVERAAGGASGTTRRIRRGGAG
jgi:GNAT superfamily N-acetyltransferase